MTEHPDHLLAELVDGTLADASRAGLDDHLSTCERCRDELRLAEEARRSLRDLPEVDEPGGIPLAVRRETRDVPRRSWRGAGIAAAAAALIGVGAIVVSSIDGDLGGRLGGGAGSGPAVPQPDTGAGGGGGGGGGGDGSTTEELAGEAPAADSAFTESRGAITPLLRDTGREYDADALSAVGRRFAQRARGLLQAGLAPTATAFFEEFRVEDLDPETRRAYRCVIAEVPPEQLVVPIGIEGATFEGEPAYVAAFLQGPTSDQPYDRVVIWVVDREACSLLSLATQRL